MSRRQLLAVLVVVVVVAGVAALYLFPGPSSDRRTSEAPTVQAQEPAKARGRAPKLDEQAGEELDAQLEPELEPGQPLPGDEAGLREALRRQQAMVETCFGILPDPPPSLRIEGVLHTVEGDTAMGPYGAVRELRVHWPDEAIGPILGHCFETAFASERLEPVEGELPFELEVEI